MTRFQIAMNDQFPMPKSPAAPIPLDYQSTTDAPLDGWGIVRWWEYRRLLYNGVILILGLLIIAAAWVVSLADRLDLQASPFVVVPEIVAYGFCANVCYTSGWILDLVWRKPDAKVAASRRRRLFKAGLIVSCIVTSAPLVLTLAIIVLKHL